MARLYVAVGVLLSVTLAAALFPWDDMETVLSKRQEGGRHYACEYIPCLDSVVSWLSTPVNFTIVAFDDAAAVDAMCRTMYSHISCWSDLAPNCRRIFIVKSMGDAIKRPVDFLCTRDGKELLLSEKACWNSLAQQTVIMDCVSKNPNPLGDCRLADEIRDCILDQVRTTCSPRVVAFLDQFAYEMMAPLAEMYGCQIRPAVPENEETQDVVGVMRRGLQQLLMMRMP